MKIAYLPIDSRPCNLDFPRKLACLAGVNIITPPSSVLDYFTYPANLDGVKKWLLDVCSTCDALVLSVDMLTYGGLLASRSGHYDLEGCRERLNAIRRIREINPCLKIFASSVIMRTSVSTLSEESKIWWEKVNNYSRLCYKVEKEKDESDAKELVKLSSEIPAHVLDAFLNARKRNHRINMDCVHMAGQRYFDVLLLLQEDSEVCGIHKSEQDLLLRKMAALGIGDRVFMQNGTDEAGCMLTARAILENMGSKIKIGFKYLTDNRDSFVAKYEDRLFHENLMVHGRACGIELDEDLDNNEIILFIHTPKERQYDACLFDGKLPESFKDEELKMFADEISKYVKMGKKVGLLDIAYANGGDGKLIKILASAMDLKDLRAYSAWNTASNALGTILAQLMLCQSGDKNKNSAFCIERFLDDLIYQSIVRKRIEHKLKTMGVDIWNLKDKKEETERMLYKHMHEEPLLKQLFKDVIPEFTCTLPWPRIFEAGIDIVNVWGD